MKEKKIGNLVKAIIFIIILVILLGIGSIIWYNNSLLGTGKEEEIEKIEIPMGSVSDKIADILSEKGMIKSKFAFKIYVKLNNIKSFQAGSYELNKSMNISEIIQVLQTGKVLKKAEVKITFVEGKPFTYIAKQITNNTKNTEDDVYKVLKDEEYINRLINKYWFITDEIKNKDIYYSLEGYLFPDTYEFNEKTVSVEEIFYVLLNKMENVLEKYKKDIEKNKYSVHEILTIASIIENEAMHDEDRKEISGVLYNRLSKKMSLGCDATTYYGLKIELGSRDLYMSELNTANPYNTRGPNMEGKLPVGPICMCSKKSIEAAIYPNNSDYLFYVTDKNGNAYFTKNSEEHQKKIKYLKDNNLWAEF